MEGGLRAISAYQSACIGHLVRVLQIMWAAVDSVVHAEVFLLTDMAERDIPEHIIPWSCLVVMNNVLFSCMHAEFSLCRW